MHNDCQCALHAVDVHTDVDDWLLVRCTWLDAELAPSTCASSGSTHTPSSTVLGTSFDATHAPVGRI